MNSQRFLVFDSHPELIGKHSFLAPSKISWQNYDIEKMFAAYEREKASAIGTVFHEMASDHIKRKRKHSITTLVGIMEDRLIQKDLYSGYLDLKPMAVNIKNFIDDAIGFRMQPEVPLVYYKDFAFGTADAISFDIQNSTLRIHDLKTGTTPAHIEQLYAYAAYACLNYKIKPADIDIYLRIYQHGEIYEESPELDIIVRLMDKIVTFTNAWLKQKEEEI